MWQRREGASKAAPTALGKALSVFATFHFVCFAWIFFRAPSFAHAVLVLKRIALFTTTAPNLSAKILAVLALGLVTHWLPDGWLAKLRDRFAASPAVMQGIALAVCAYVLHFAAGAKPEPFIYGQF